MESHVTQVLLDENNRAYGVTFQRNGKVQTVRAKREVILSGGALNTPQLLMLSGIGPAAHLQDMGIPVVKVSV
jgi:choline dehydrogenase